MFQNSPLKHLQAQLSFIYLTKNEALTKHKTQQYSSKKSRLVLILRQTKHL